MPTLVLCTGFDHGVNNVTSLVKGNTGIKYADTITPTPEIVSTTPRTGGFCLQMAVAGSTKNIRWGVDTLGAAGNVMVVGFGLYFPSALPSSDGMVLHIQTSSATIDLAMSFRNSDDKLIINTSSGSGTARASANAMVADTWYWIDLRFTTSGTSWTADWAIDTVAQTQFTHTAPTSDTISVVGLGPEGAVGTFTCRYDDLLVSKTSGDYPLGPHHVELLTADAGGTTAQIGTTDATSRFVTNSAADATHNSANILTALTDGPPPTFGGSASGVAQRLSGSGNAVGIPMTTYTLTGGETISGVRIEIPGWAASTTAATLGFRTYNGTTETTLQAGTVDPNFDADTAAPGWFCEMATAADFDTQAELDAMVIRIGYSTDISPVIGAHAVYAAVAIKESTSTPVSLADTATATDALGVAAAVPLADTASAADALAIAAAVPLADTAVAVDARASTAAVPLTDTAAATDALSLGPAAVSLADTATGSDALQVAAAVPLADTAAAAETLSAGVPISLADTAAAADALSSTAALPLADTAAAADALTATAAVALADTAAGDDSLSVFAPAVIDPYQATPQIAGMFLDPDAASFQLQGSQVTSGDQIIGLADSASASESLSISVTLTLADTAAAAEFMAAGVPISLADTASASDALSSTATLPLGDTATATDALTAAAAVALADAAATVELLAAGVPKTLSDTAAAADSLLVGAVAVALADTASAADLLASPSFPVTGPVEESRISTGTDARRASTGTETVRGGTGTDARRGRTGSEQRRVSTGNDMFRITTDLE